MHIDLTGRKAIVTGSTAGIGRATAEGLARAGAAVVVNGRGNARVDEAARQIRDAVPGSDVSGVATDLSTMEGVEALVAQSPDADILVNNVGTREPCGWRMKLLDCSRLTMLDIHGEFPKTSVYDAREPLPPQGRSSLRRAGQHRGGAHQRRPG